MAGKLLMMLLVAPLPALLTIQTIAFLAGEKMPLALAGVVILVSSKVESPVRMND